MRVVVPAHKPFEVVFPTDDRVLTPVQLAANGGVALGGFLMESCRLMVLFASEERGGMRFNFLTRRRFSKAFTSNQSLGDSRTSGYRLSS